MSEEIVSVTALSRHFGDTVALDRVTLNVARGTVFGLVGENGAGKTTLIRHLLGLQRAQAGSVRVFGLDPVGDPVGVLGRIGYLSEERDLPDWMRLGELISYSRAFYPRWDDRFARDLLAMFDLNPGQKVRTLSRGQRARAGLLVALAHRPEFLVLDEPSSGLDPSARQDILAAVVRTVADEGRTVLLSSHLLHEVQRVADQVAMLHHGRLLLDEQVDDLLARHRLLTLHFPCALAAQPKLTGGLCWWGEGTEWTCLTDGEQTLLREAAAAAGAEIVEERPPSLEEVFLAQQKHAAARSEEP
jgi:ABC-2 type transport system ATP-binding protein